jgi:PHD/YefM family antitoxin component YafN of YafNO toxin-antitoxin module
MIRTIPAREIKRRGISAVDELVCDGPVHVIRNDEPTYVILSEAHFRNLMDDIHEAHIERVKASLEDVKAGRVTRYESVEDLIAKLQLKDAEE